MKTRITATAALAVAALGAAASANAAEYANVLSATPVMAAVDGPRVVCDERYVQPRSPGGGALIGALIGGVVGNQIGHGFGRAAATGIGAVAGAAIGNHAETGGHAGRDCRTVGGYQNRVVGYDVVYEYRGQRYTTRTARDPGPRLAIDGRMSGGAVPPAAAYGAQDGHDGYPGRAPNDIDPYSTSEDPRASYYDAPAPVYSQPPRSQYAPAPIYYAPAPVYYDYAPAPYYVAPRPYYGPSISIGIQGGRQHRHHRHQGHHRSGR